jgi:hypothetical protein
MTELIYIIWLRHIMANQMDDFPFSNPPPPQEIHDVAHEDLVENTMISKRQLFRILIKIVEVIWRAGSQSKSLYFLFL